MEQITIIDDPILENGLDLERSPACILESALNALNEGNIDEVVSEFHEPFTFTDHALDLVFSEKARLVEFLQESRELFPDSVLEVFPTFNGGITPLLNGRLRQRRP
jgi:hypothetical protein